MKIAVIHNGETLESWLWFYHFLLSLKKNNPHSEIVVFCNDVHDFSMNIKNELSNYGVCVIRKKIFLKKKVIHNFVVGFLIRKYLNQNYDMVLNSCPFFTWTCKLKIPYYFVCHDLIFLHYFGHHCSNVYSRKVWKETQQSIRKYLDNGCIPCFSSDFIADEFIKSFQYKKDLIKKIVPVPHINDICEFDEINYLKKNDINCNYILLYTGSAHFKNTEEVLSAYYLVKQVYPDIKMLIIGEGIEDIYVKMDSYFYATHVMPSDKYDIKSIHISCLQDLQILIKNSKIYINMALYESICYSIIYAWYLGVPTLLSNISAHKEQCAYFRVKSNLVDPKNSDEIADKLLDILDNYDREKIKAISNQNSLSVMRKYNWIGDGLL